ncbi:Lig-chan-Glu-bd domain-containing protein [Aphelenchoides fujianensis]|nr:Lig-chan-Glu-bd domain-containing protein [Aphelenchoides fujianensis]
MLRKSVLPNVRRLYKHLLKTDAIIYAETIQDGIEMVKEDPRLFFMGPKDTFNLVAQRDCRLLVVNEAILPASTALAVRAGSPYVRLLDKIILDLVERGFVQKWLTGYGFYIGSSFNGSCFEPKNSQLELKMAIFIGPFILFAGGLGLGLVFFGIELMRAAYVKAEIGVRIQQFIGSR